MAEHKLDDEKSVYLDREEHVHKGELGAKRIVVYYYDSNTDTLVPATSSSGKATEAYSIQAISLTATYKYFFFENTTPDWYIMRKTLATNVFSYAKGTGSYTTVYVDATSDPSGSPTFGTYGSTF